MTVIECTGLTRTFRGRRAVDDIDLSIGCGVVGVLGPNGAGKSTLLAMLATTLAPTRGSFSVFGLDVNLAAERLRIRRRLGYLPQHATLYPGFTVRRILEYVAVLKEITDPMTRRRAIDDALSALELDGHADRAIRALSGGLRQRTSIAAAILGNPELLILDEPAAGLDPEQHRALHGIVAAAGGRGTVLMATHHPADVAEWCDHVIVLNSGAVRFNGRPDQLAALAPPAHSAYRSPGEAIEAGYLAITAASKSST